MATLRVTAGAAVVSLLLLFPALGRAHEIHVLEADGQKYLFAVGFQTEPAVLGERSVIDISIHKAARSLAELDSWEALDRETSLPGKSLGTTDEPLEITVLAPDGARSRFAFPLYWYLYIIGGSNMLANFIPTLPGTYTFTFQGSLDGIPYSLEVTCVSGDPHRTRDVRRLRETVSSRVVRTAVAGGVPCPVPPETRMVPAPPVATAKESSSIGFWNAVGAGVLALLGAAALFAIRVRRAHRYPGIP